MEMPIRLKLTPEEDRKVKKPKCRECKNQDDQNSPSIPTYDSISNYVWLYIYIYIYILQHCTVVTISLAD